MLPKKVVKSVKKQKNPYAQAFKRIHLHTCYVRPKSCLNYFLKKKNSYFRKFYLRIKVEFKKKLYNLKNRSLTRISAVGRKSLQRYTYLKKNFQKRAKFKKIPLLKSKKISWKKKKALRRNAFFFKRLRKKLASLPTLNLHKTLKNFCIKKGNKKNAVRSATAAWASNVTLRIVPRAKIQALLFSRLHIQTELRKYRTKKKVSLVPSLINIPRQMFLTTQLIYAAVVATRSPHPFSARLNTEVLSVQTNSGNAIPLKVKINEQCHRSRGNAHFRW